MAQGRLITFEGAEACGKSTQCRLLAEWFRRSGQIVRELREPGGTPLGEKLRHILKYDADVRGMSPESELMLMNASRAELVQMLIRPALAAGEIVICDRFYDSTIAYQGFGRQMNLEQVRNIIALAVGETKPDLTLWLNVPAETAEGRLSLRQSSEGVSDRFESEQDAFFHRVREGYRLLAAAEPERVVEIDGVGSPEDVHLRVAAATRERLDLKLSI
jgi:dTMP kinase